MPPSKSKKPMPIAVYVRQRPQSKQEIEEQAACVLEIPNCKQIFVKHSACEKQYRFDEVFGPFTAQCDVYHKALQPLISDVLKGYNCTVFAYGQTGTGKTYTIVGNFDDNTKSLSENPHAGLITRAALEIFQKLSDPSVKEYTVRVSFIELYNEELKDLLRDADNVPLRLYEDPCKKGSVIVQNLLEKTVCNAEEVYQILLNGMEKRQTAVTLLNDQSSRSHCVFTINVYMKGVLVTGEELVKTGKLNLVDLAGSENICRSGAVNTRAREAGNINQSLLTLGRVIKGLVEKQSHIPYRDSKLTRLLQDSLGGKTKTAIIATVSPSSICLDETISTLDYASRACLIINCPEVNKHSSKSQIIDILTRKIQAIQKDITALRRSSGFYVDPDNYQELLTENEKKENLIVSKNEMILRLEEEMQELIKLVEFEEKRWDELIESFKFTKLKCEEYRRKNLTVKAELKMLHRLINLYTEEGRRTAERNRNIKQSLASLGREINTLSDKLNNSYNKSQQYNQTNEIFFKMITEAVNNIDSSIEKFQANTAQRQAKANEILRELTSLIDSVSENVQKNQEKVAECDLDVKRGELENCFVNEKLRSVNYCKRLEDNLVEAVNSVEERMGNAETKTEKRIVEFERTIKNDSMRKVAVLTDLCGKMNEIKNKTHEKANTEASDEFIEKFTESNAEIQNFVCNKMLLSLKRQKFITTLQEKLKQLETKEKAEYQTLKHVFERTKNSATNADIVKENVRLTAKEISKNLESLDLIAEMAKMKDCLNQSRANKSNIAEQFKEDVKCLQTFTQTEFNNACSAAVKENKQIVGQYVERNEENCMLVKDRLEMLKALTKENCKNLEEKLPAIRAGVCKITEVFSNIDHEKSAKNIEIKLANIDKANTPVCNLKNKWLHVEPSGGTPKKQDYNYTENLETFSTPNAVKSLKSFDDDSLLDVSVGSLNISAVPPEEFSNIEELLEQQDISVNDSVLLIESEKSASPSP